jgi:hypothetical protein
VVGAGRSSPFAPPLPSDPLPSAPGTVPADMKSAVMSGARATAVPEAARPSSPRRARAAGLGSSHSAPVEQTRVASPGPIQGRPRNAIETSPIETPSKPIEFTSPPPESVMLPQPPKPLPVPSEIAESIDLSERARSAAQARPAQINPVVTSIDYVAPRPLRRVAPLVSASLRNLAVPGTRIDVMVHIDAAGKVVDVEPLSTGNRLTSRLSSITADAVRQWLFSPALRGNRTVPSEIVLQFRFGNAE